jgi:hypothetical protein
VAVLLVLAFLAFSALAYLLSRTVASPRARPGSIVAQSDWRNAATGWIFLSAFLLAPLSLLAIVVLLAIDMRAWIASTRAALRQRRGKPPVKSGVDFGLGPDWMLEPAPSIPYRASLGPVVGTFGSPRDGARAIAGNMGRLVLAAMGTSLWLALWDFGSRPCRHHIGSTRAALSTAHSATIIWRQDFPDGPCPTVDQLKALKILDTGFNSKDVWGNPILLTCEADDIVARSAGPDRRLGTDDDIRVPSQ